MIATDHVLADNTSGVRRKSLRIPALQVVDVPKRQRRRKVEQKTHFSKASQSVVLICTEPKVPKLKQNGKMCQKKIACTETCTRE